jgi:hypothetical protein
LTIIPDVVDRAVDDLKVLFVEAVHSFIARATPLIGNERLKTLAACFAQRTGTVAVTPGDSATVTN